MYSYVVSESGFKLPSTNKLPLFADAADRAAKLPKNGLWWSSYYNSKLLKRVDDAIPTGTRSKRSKKQRPTKNTSQKLSGAGAAPLLKKKLAGAEAAMPPPKKKLPTSSAVQQPPVPQKSLPKPPLGNKQSSLQPVGDGGLATPATVEVQMQRVAEEKASKDEVIVCSWCCGQFICLCLCLSLMHSLAVSE
jgi:hypothetical protein